MKIRAIYIPDLRYDKIPIFELNKDKFINIKDAHLSYPVDIVLSDKDWLIVSVDTDEDKIENIRT